MNALETARASGLVTAGEPLLVLLSGGADSVCLLDVATRIASAVPAWKRPIPAESDSVGDYRIADLLLTARFLFTSSGRASAARVFRGDAFRGDGAFWTVRDPGSDD